MSRKLAPEANRYVLWNLLPLLTLAFRAIPQKPAAHSQLWCLPYTYSERSMLICSSSDRILFVKNLKYVPSMLAIPLVPQSITILA